MFYGDIYDIPEELGRFDVVFFGLVLHQLRDPLWALYQGARLCRDTLIISDRMYDGDLLPTMALRGGEDSALTWWDFSIKLYEKWLPVLGFRISRLTHGYYSLINPEGVHPYRLSTIVARPITL